MLNYHQDQSWSLLSVHFYDTQILNVDNEGLLFGTWNESGHLLKDNAQFPKESSPIRCFDNKNTKPFNDKSLSNMTISTYCWQREVVIAWTYRPVSFVEHCKLWFIRERIKT
jgi:hypothetical protein